MRSRLTPPQRNFMRKKDGTTATAEEVAAWRREFLEIERKRELSHTPEGLTIPKDRT
jgi:hypothetical protein